MINSFLAEKERKKALAASNVKVIGVDVMATKKLLTTMIMYPPICIGFTLFFYYLTGKM
jgi:hypothetical protein